MRKTRAVLMGTGGWPFIIDYWLETLKLWESAVDKVYIAIEHFKEPSVSEHIKERTKNDPKIVVFNDARGWPDSYTDAFNISKEDLFLVMHDDTYIKNPEIVDKYFELAEQGKVVTPLHEIYNPKEIVEDMLKTKYPGIFPLKSNPQEGDMGGLEGYSFLLYLLFISRENLEKTTVDFNGWQENKMGADTGFKLELDLLDKGIEIYAIPRYSTAVLPFMDNPFGELAKWDFNKIPYIHLQNIGNTIPAIVERDDVDSTWKHEGVILRLGWLLEYIKVTGYNHNNKDYIRSMDRINKILTTFDIPFERVEKYADIFHKLVFES